MTVLTVCVSPGPAASGSTPSVITSPSVTSAPTPDPPRVVMSVEEFYYGSFEGDLSLRKPQPLGIKTSTFTCQICSYLAENNLRWDHLGARSHLNCLSGGAALYVHLCVCVCVCACRLMQHMLQHSELIGGGGDEKKCCRFCYRQFSSLAQLKSHQDQVHGPAPSSCKSHTCPHTWQI